MQLSGEALGQQAGGPRPTLLLIGYNLMLGSYLQNFSHFMPCWWGYTNTTVAMDILAMTTRCHSVSYVKQLLRVPHLFLVFNVGDRAVHGGTPDALHSFLVESVPLLRKGQEGHWAHSIWLVLWFGSLSSNKSLTNITALADSYFWGVGKTLQRLVPAWPARGSTSLETCCLTVPPFKPSSFSPRIGRASCSVCSLRPGGRGLSCQSSDTEAHAGPALLSRHIRTVQL